MRAIAWGLEAPAANPTGWRIRKAILLMLAVAHFFVLVVGLASAQGEWAVGQTVGLAEGTCIREGPGLSYPAHTRVPENDWLVMVIGGPRFDDEKTWFDTSRREAGDPSGGTGWVDSSQTDLCPLQSPDPPGRDRAGGAKDILDRVKDWWRQQGATGKWIAALLALAVVVWLWSRLALSIWGLVRVVLLGALIWWALDLSRDTWESAWTQLAGSDAPDLALLLAFLPALSYLLPRLLGARRGRW